MWVFSGIVSRVAFLFTFIHIHLFISFIFSSVPDPFIHFAFYIFFISHDSFNAHQSVEGTGLVFIVFTQAIVELPAAPFWAIIFFMMLLALGVGSQIGTLEGVISTVFDIQIVRGARKEVVSGEYILYSLTLLPVSHTLNFIAILWTEKLFLID